MIYFGILFILVEVRSLLTACRCEVLRRLEYMIFGKSSLFDFAIACNRDSVAGILDDGALVLRHEAR
jgi:hypothetical protein